MVKDSESNGAGLSQKQLKQKQKQALKKKEKKQRNKQNKKQNQNEQQNEDLLKKQLVDKINEIQKQAKQNEQEQDEIEIEQNNNIEQQQNGHHQENGEQQQINGENGEEQEEENIDALNFLTGQYYEEFKDVFQNFDNLADRMWAKTLEIDEENLQAQKEKEEKEQKDRQQAADERREQREKQRLDKENQQSRKQRKSLRWLKVAQIKALVKRPDLVEAWDITGPDPLLLVQLKSQRNTVGVPEHWSQKRKFLQNKRGILKAPFRLPDHVEQTGIAKLRDPFTERDGVAMVKQKLKDRMNPKLGKIDIDYEILHDAFFKYATKPKMTIHGDLYREGKEEMVQQNKYKPGRMSEELRNALGITEYQPPPWLINMQRYGPPPAYPQLRILGEGGNNYSGFMTKQQQIEEASKAINQPGIYATFKIDDQDEEDRNVDKGYWGALLEDDEYENEEEIEQQEEEEEESDDLQPNFATEITKHQQDLNDKNLQSGTTSVLDGLQTPEVDLRKNREDQFQYSQKPAGSELPLFQVLEPTQASGNSGGIFTGGQGYIIPDNKQSQQ